MRAVAFWEHGGLDVLQLVDDWPEPIAGPGQVVVEVKACGLNHMDVFVREGMPGVKTHFPHVSGCDISGVVHSVAPDVAGFAVGDSVLVDPLISLPDGRGIIGEHVPGGLCERIAVGATNLLALPDTVSFEIASALPVAYGAAHRMLFTRGALTADETVVVLGASGGVGVACVQLAKRAGARVIAVASTDDKLERLRALGADELVRARGAEYGAEVWRLTNKRGADVIVDNTGAATWPTTLRTVSRHGRVLVCGATTGFEATTDLRYVWTREQTIIGSDVWERSDLEALLTMTAAGELDPVVDRVVGLDAVAAAEADIESRAIFGKVIVRP